MNCRKYDFFCCQTISAVVVGADRVVRNGDTANKIGTYQLAVLALHHKIPFYVASPTTTIDMRIEDGTGIPIEERKPEELTRCGCERKKNVAAKGENIGLRRFYDVHYFHDFNAPVIKA